MGEIADYATEYFDDPDEARRMYDGMIALCEALMYGWPEYRMMWAVEDFYLDALEEEENF